MAHEGRLIAAIRDAIDAEYRDTLRSPQRRMPMPRHARRRFAIARRRLQGPRASDISISRASPLDAAQRLRASARRLAGALRCLAQMPPITSRCRRRRAGRRNATFPAMPDASRRIS